MTSYTQNILLDIFGQLLDSTSFDNITVSDIITESNISRNTFYYHFKDVNTLLDKWLSQQLERYDDQVADSYWLDGIKQFYHAAYEHKHWVEHLLNSSARSHVERYLFTYNSRAAYKFALQITPGNRDTLYISAVSDILRYAIVGYFLRYYLDGMTADIDAQVERIGRMFETVLKIKR
jgi:AcrR family transcriptional regulator